MLLRSDAIADRIYLCFHFVQCMDRNWERCGAKQMVRVIVRDVEACERFPERHCIGQCFLRVGNRILGVNRDQLLRQSDEMSIDLPPIVGSRVRMNFQTATFANADCCSEEACFDSSWKLTAF